MTALIQCRSCQQPSRMVFDGLCWGCYVQQPSVRRKWICKHLRPTETCDECRLDGDSDGEMMKAEGQHD